MAYYVVGRDTKASGKYAYFPDEPDGYDGDMWRTGESIESPPALTLAARKGSGELSDMILNAADLQIYSPALIAVLAASGVDNIQYGPVVLKTGAKTKRDDYKLANILGAIECLDVQRARIRRSRGGTIMNVEEFEVLPERIGAKRWFRLAEQPFLVIAHESVKHACERTGITGIVFTSTGAYTD